MVEIAEILRIHGAEYREDFLVPVRAVSVIFRAKFAIC
jgi:hypothetical protein